jgi:hypothetical protein
MSAGGDDEDWPSWSTAVSARAVGVAGSLGVPSGSGECPSIPVAPGPLTPASIIFTLPGRWRMRLGRQRSPAGRYWTKVGRGVWPHDRDDKYQDRLCTTVVHANAATVRNRQ